jgi:hypothetical protein
MRALPAFFLALLCSLPALATSHRFNAPEFNAGEAGYLSAGNSGGSWTPRIPGLTRPAGNPHMFPTTFTDTGFAVTCTPVCGIGDSFSTSLLMSGFTLQVYPYQGDPMIGTLTLLTQPIILRGSSGIAIAKFTLTGDLVACTNSTCNDELFGLDVNIHGYAKLTYSLVSGRLTVSSVSYVLPEPSSLVLFGTGLLSVIARVRFRAGRKGTSPAIRESV